MPAIRSVALMSGCPEVSDGVSIWVMDSPDRPRSFTRTHLGSPSPDPPDWVNGRPTSAIDQSCAFCGTDDVAWVHPLARDLLTYRELGKEHTLPTFWSLCERCEEIYASADDDAAVEVMRSSSSWAWVEAEDVAVSLRRPLAVFRRADLGALRFEPEPPHSAVTESER